MKNKKVEQLPLNARPRVASDVVFQEHDDGRVEIAKGVEAEGSMELEGLAAEVWLRIDGSKPIRRLIDEMAKELKLPRPRFDNDVQKLLRELELEGLLEPLS